MNVVIYQIANAVTMFAYEMSITVCPLVGRVARHSMPNCQHRALFQVQLYTLAFPGKLSFFPCKVFQESVVIRYNSGLDFGLYMQPSPVVCSEKSTLLLCVSISSQHGCVFEF